MLELYQDDLADLLLPASQKQQGPQKVHTPLVESAQPCLCPACCRLCEVKTPSAASYQESGSIHALHSGEA